MSVKDGKSQTQVDAERREASVANERAEWAKLYRTYERCVDIADKVWSDRLGIAASTQQGLAESMRDRGAFTEVDAAGKMRIAGLAIPVPLFTPRDRQQFLKEVAATLLISADRRNLTVLFPKESTDAPEKSLTGEAPAAEAASGTDEADLDAEARDLTPEETAR